MARDARIFDLDGTLVLSHAAYAAAIAKAGAGAEADILAALRSGGNVVALMRASGISQTAMRRGLDTADVEAVDGCADVLAELRRRQHPVGIVTSLPGWLAKELLTRTRLESSIDALVTNARKPSPSGIVEALRLLGRRPGQGNLYVGDTHADAEAARRAGVSFAWASWGYGMPLEPALSQLKDLLS